MDTSTYDQFVITGEQLGEAKDYIKDNLVLERISYESETLGVELPISWSRRRIRDLQGIRRLARGSPQPSRPA